MLSTTEEEERIGGVVPVSLEKKGSQGKDIDQC